MPKTRIIVALVALALALPAVADAAPVRECGTYSDEGWTYGPASGYWLTLTTRNVRCRYARPFALNWNGRRAYRGYTCRRLAEAHEYLDVRCTASRGRAIRWQTGA